MKKLLKFFKRANVVERNRDQTAMLWGINTRKAERFEKLAAHYTELAKQHRKVAAAYEETYITLGIDVKEVLNLSNVDIHDAHVGGLIVDDRNIPLYDPRKVADIARQVHRTEENNRDQGTRS